MKPCLVHRARCRFIRSGSRATSRIGDDAVFRQPRCAPKRSQFVRAYRLVLGVTGTQIGVVHFAHLAAWPDEFNPALLEKQALIQK